MLKNKFIRRNHKKLKDNEFQEKTEELKEKLNDSSLDGAT